MSSKFKEVVSLIDKIGEAFDNRFQEQDQKIENLGKALEVFKQEKDSRDNLLIEELIGMLIGGLKNLLVRVKKEKTEESSTETP